MKIAILAVPYDAGRRGFRMGAGPEHLLAGGLPDAIKRAGHSVATRFIETSAHDELAAAFDIARQLAFAVSNCRTRGEWPLVLSGNCLAALGVFAGLVARPLVLWLDAHADFNTPETSPSGFVDGMALSVLTGRCYREAASTLPHFQPLRYEHLLMLGVRAVDPGENEPLTRVRMPRSSRQLWNNLAHSRLDELYLHIDLDALDPSVLRANSFAAPHGLSMHTVHDVIDAAKANKRIAALTISAYEPQADARNDGPRIVQEIVEHIVV